MKKKYFIVSRETSFSAGHHLREYEGDCANLHGHNWRVNVSVASDALDDLGMVIDFGKLEFHVNSIISRLDHTLINEVPPFDTINPTSENIAKFIFDELECLLSHKDSFVYCVEIFETDRSLARYGYVEI